MARGIYSKVLGGFSGAISVATNIPVVTAPPAGGNVYVVREVFLESDWVGIPQGPDLSIGGGGPGGAYLFQMNRAARQSPMLFHEDDYRMVMRPGDTLTINIGPSTIGPTIVRCLVFGYSLTP